MATRLSPDLLDPRNNLQYYTPSAIKNADVWTDANVRKEYSRLRDIAQKRLARLEILEPDSYAYRKNAGRFAPARGQSTADLRAQLPELAKFIAAKTGSVTGIRAQRAKAVAALQERGYTGITKQNIKAFGEFMDEWRAKKLDRTIGSPTAAELFEFTQDNEIPWETVKENFAGWLREREKLEDFVKKQNRKGQEVSADDIIQRFDQLEAQRQKKNERARRARAAKKSSTGGKNPKAEAAGVEG